ncbi:hypothetical protein HDV05_000360 [Chytridiales sp. JEL 0842]|nr:hypothetical protein HDV05_000360 [Chytridiales sp. JEL 0842]
MWGVPAVVNALNLIGLFNNWSSFYGSPLSAAFAYSGSQLIIKGDDQKNLNSKLLEDSDNFVYRYPRALSQSEAQRRYLDDATEAFLFVQAYEYRSQRLVKYAWVMKSEDGPNIVSGARCFVLDFEQYLRRTYSADDPIALDCLEKSVEWLSPYFSSAKLLSEKELEEFDKELDLKEMFAIKQNLERE